MERQTVQLDEAKKMAHEKLEKMGNQIPSELIPAFEEALSKLIVGNDSLKDVMGITDNVMEQLYREAYNLFQNGKYQNALTIFNALRYLDITDGRYTFSIAACYYGQQEYLDAAANYLIFREMDPLNPIASYRLYDCYVKANFPSAALFYIQEALVLAKMDPKYDCLLEKIQLEAEQYNIIYNKYCKEKYGSAAA